MKWEVNRAAVLEAGVKVTGAQRHGAVLLQGKWIAECVFLFFLGGWGVSSNFLRTKEQWHLSLEISTQRNEIQLHCCVVTEGCGCLKKKVKSSEKIEMKAREYVSKDECNSLICINTLKECSYYNSHTWTFQCLALIYSVILLHISVWHTAALQMSAGDPMWRHAL